MLLGARVKTQAERKRMRVDYSDWLGASEIIVSPVTYQVSQEQTEEVPLSPLVVDASSIAADGKSIVFFVSLGDLNVSYSVDIKASTSTGQVKEDTVKFSVRAPTSAC